MDGAINYASQLHTHTYTGAPPVPVNHAQTLREPTAKHAGSHVGSARWSSMVIGNKSPLNEHFNSSPSKDRFEQGKGVVKHSRMEVPRTAAPRAQGFLGEHIVSLVVLLGGCELRTSDWIFNDNLKKLPKKYIFCAL